VNVSSFYGSPDASKNLQKASPTMQVTPAVLADARKYSFKESFSIERNKCTLDSSGSRVIPGKIFELTEPGVTLNVEFRETATSAATKKILLDAFISSQKSDVTFLSGQIHSIDSSRRFTLHKLFNNAQRFSAPQHVRLNETDLNETETSCVLGNYADMNFLFTGCVLISSRILKDNHLEILYAKLHDMPVFTSGKPMLVDSENKPDILLKVGEKKFHAHKEILMLRSRIFEAMFNSDTKERRESSVVIEDFDETIVEEMILFMYTDTCTRIGEIAKDLLAAADKYFIDKMKLLCEIELTKQMDVKNACEISKVAEAYNSETLTDFTTNYIIENYQTIVNEVGWEVVHDMPKKVFATVMKAVSGK